MIRIQKGLDLPIEGIPTQEVEQARNVRQVALVGDDYVGMKPGLAVAVGDSVKLGQTLFTDKKTPGVKYASPGCGTVAAVNRGAKRKFESVVIELDGDDQETFAVGEGADPSSLGNDEIRRNLIDSGLWTSLRTRPYSKVPAPDSSPHSLFVTAMDTNPLAADAAPIIGRHAEDFATGLRALAQLTEGPIHVCTAPGVDVPGRDIERVSLSQFEGPHPAGLAGTHIHFLDPASEKKTVWYVNYQDVIAMGRFFTTGRLYVERTISLAGPAVKKPRLIQTRLGAAVDELTENQLKEEPVRVISGSVLSGRRAVGGYAFLGRYHLQISAIADKVNSQFLGWILPGMGRYSIMPVYASVLSGKGRKFSFTSSSEGSPRAIIPVGAYEKVMPMDVIPTALLKAVASNDVERAQSLGCLEMDEEDLALCSFVCPGKHDFGSLLREVLTNIEKEG
jgi:Na+-transporting NADH:ubiquinone oxidoreductase subunit A